MPAYVFDKKTNEFVKVAGNAVNADLKDMNVYSTEEKIVGTWIDGKPIYRKVVQTKTPEKANTTTAVASLGVDISQVVKIDGYIIIGAGSLGFVPVNGAIINDETFKGTWVSANNIYMSVNEYYSNRDVTVIVEYTKTTD